MSERTRPTEIPKRTVTRGIATVAALLMAGGVGGCSADAAPAPRATVTVTKTVEATLSSPESVKTSPEASRVTLTSAWVDRLYSQATTALKQGDLETAEQIYRRIIVNAGTEKDYDGDGDEELPYEALKAQIDKSK